MQVTYRRIMKLHIFNTGITYWLIIVQFSCQPSSLVDYGIFTTVLPEYYMEVHTNILEVAPNRTPTPLAVVEAKHAQGRQSGDLIFFPHLTFLFDFFIIFIPWDSSCEQGEKPRLSQGVMPAFFTIS